MPYQHPGQDERGWKIRNEQEAEDRLNQNLEPDQSESGDQPRNEAHPETLEYAEEQHRRTKLNQSHEAAPALWDPVETNAI